MLEESDIQKLVGEATRGNSESFGTLYDEFAPKVFNFIFGRVRHKPTAEDLLHVVFMKVWNNLPKYKPSTKAKFSTWLFQIANFTVIDYWRTNKNTINLDQLENLSSLAVNQKLYENYDYLWTAIKELPDDYQTIIQLKFIQDLSISETAAAMGKSEVGIRVLQHRALKALKKILAKNGHETF
jgi:RNA polymerase sigma-70 factor, ECF subfamily